MPNDDVILAKLHVWRAALEEIASAENSIARLLLGDLKPKMREEKKWHIGLSADYCNTLHQAFNHLPRVDAKSLGWNSGVGVAIADIVLAISRLKT
jgi:hypothetical protein